MSTQPQGTPERLPVNDPLAFVEHRAATGKPPEFHFESVGDHLAGFVTEVEVVNGVYGPFRIVSVITRGEEEFSFRAVGAVLSARLAKVRVGDAIGVRRVEDGFSPEHKSEFKNYEVTIVATERPLPAPSLPPAEVEQMLDEAFSDEVDDVF
ncbi:MAG TPA: hypothetical protein VN886_16105 [Acidimicrobiales bacterium]|nr:hypothetical protein [Acidimicrobiales bacterium]